MKSGSTASGPLWRRDALAASALFLATASFVLWQNAHIAVLWDLSYLLDTSWRFALGQVPYRDFPLVHPPLTFLIQSLLMRVAGRNYSTPVLYASILSGLGSVLSWRIALRVVGNSLTGSYWIALLLTLPLVFVGIHGIYPHPIYDCDCSFAILAGIFFLQRLELSRRSALRAWLDPSLAGAATVLPLFFKQNMGLPFLLSAVAGTSILLLLRPRRDPDSFPSAAPGGQPLLRYLLAVLVSGFSGLLLLQFTVGLENYLHWTVHFAAERRLPGFAEMISVYRQPSFGWSIPAFGGGLVLLHTRLANRLWARILAVSLGLAPFVASLIFLSLNDDPDERADNLLALWPLLLIAAAVTALFALRKGLAMRRLIPFYLLAAVHGAFLSQQLWGSTYAIWPLLILLAATIFAELPPVSRNAGMTLAAGISITLLVCGGLYALSRERLSYIAGGSAAPVRATLPAIRGMSAPGPYLPDFEELIRFSEHEIAPEEGVLLLPGEEPFFFATGRTPRFPVQIFDRTTDPYSAAELIGEARRRGVRWVIVKTRLQLDENPLPEPEETLGLVVRKYRLYRRLSGYDVYRKQ